MMIFAAAAEQPSAAQRRTVRSSYGSKWQEARALLADPDADISRAFRGSR
jgi:hypothetical protein